MELDFALLAAAADASQGKINLLGGGFDTFNVAKIPATVPPFAIVARFRLTPGEPKEKHTIAVELVSPNGDVEKILKDSGDTRFINPTERPTNSLAVIQVAWKFEEAGNYKLRLYGDGQLMKTFDLTVALQPELSNESET